jgi:surfactin family lipopeptide synthetase A
LGDFKVNAFVLTPELSEMVLQKIHGTYNTNANDVLLTALAIALKQWDGQSSHAVTLESHGRNNIMDNVHVDRTVGWFTAIYPVIIQYCDDLKENVIQTKEMLRKIPSEGLGYGLCLLGGGNYENTEIAFNYLGEMDSDVAEDGWVHVSKLSTGRSVSPKNDSWQNFALNCMCVKKRLQIEVTYDASAYASERIDEFFDVYENALKEIADRCLGAEAEKTMSDFGVYDMSEDDAELLNSLL